MLNTAEIQYFRKQFLYEKKLESVEITMVMEQAPKFYIVSRLFQNKVINILN